MKILVTGANGFVGKGLLPRLTAGGHSVRAAVRAPVDLPVETVAVGMIGPGTGLGRALDGIDAVVHLAARVHVLREGATDPLEAFRQVNVAGTGRLAAQARQAGVKRFVLMSSVKAAADITSGRSLTERDPPAPGTPYGISKWEGEQALVAAAGGMGTVILRPPLVYGPGVGANFRALLRLVDSGLPLPLGSVRNQRSLIARDNLVDAVAAALTAPGAAGGTFFVTDGPALSTLSLIRELAAALGRPARLMPGPVGLMRSVARLAGKGDAADSLLGSLEIDDAAFRTATNWRPPVSHGDAFRAVANWYRNV